jgi:hypothetical protein
MGRREDMNEQGIGGPEPSRGRSSLVNVVLGLWIIISAFVLGLHAPKAIWNNVVTGLLVGALAVIRWAMNQPGLSWMNLFLGIWLVISPFVLVLGTAAMWNNVLLGIIVAALALTNTYSRASTPIGT